MAAASPRKRAPRKAPAPKPSPNRAAIEAYGEFRERARKSGLRLRQNDEGPYVIPGFDPPIAARFPRKLVDREEFDEASRNRNLLGMLRVLLAADDYRRVLTAFDAFDDGDDLLIGLVMKIIDHANGEGASEAPGGSTPS